MEHLDEGPAGNGRGRGGGSSEMPLLTLGAGEFAQPPSKEGGRGVGLRIGEERSMAAGVDVGVGRVGLGLLRVVGASEQETHLSGTGPGLLRGDGEASLFRK